MKLQRFLFGAFALASFTGWTAEWIGEHGETNFVWRTGQTINGKTLKSMVTLPKNTLWLRKTFALESKPIAKATVRLSSGGFSELWLNGAKVDPRRVLAPAVGNYLRDMLYVETYDVTGKLTSGAENTLGLWLAPGYGDDMFEYAWRWCAPKRAMLTLDVAYADGTHQKVETDGTWQSNTNTPILKASIYNGEQYDASKENPNWATPKDSSTGWQSVCIFPDGPTLKDSITPPIRLTDPTKPVRITKDGPGAYTVDFGVNRAAVVKMRARGPKGTTIRLQTSEQLGDNGKIDPWSNCRADSTDEFILAGTGDVESYTPRFTYHGFRYAQITGWPGELKTDDLENWAVHADVKPTATFACSDPMLMKIYEAARRTMLTDFMSYPTDTAVRGERTPCLMDSQAYEDSACQMFDMRNFYAQWESNNDNTSGEGNPDWHGDACILPMRLYEYYGDKAKMEEDYPIVKRFVVEHIAQHGTIYESGYGDWCAPNNNTWEGFFNDPGVVNSSLFALYIKRLSEVAADLGKTDDAKQFAEAYEKAKVDFNAKFYDPEKGVYGDGSQATAVLPLSVGLVPDAIRSIVVSNLLTRIRTTDKGTMDTGIFGTRYIGDVLCDLGQSDLLVSIYTQTNYPGYGNIIAEGGTSLWEQWRNKGVMNSHCHAMFAGGISCFFTRLAGIRPAKPGYAEVLIQPSFPTQLTFVEATRETPHGTVAVSWKRSTRGIDISITIPEKVPAKLVLPDGTEETLKPGKNESHLSLH